MPLGPAYDKLIESRFADIKNTGGRAAGAITAAAFLARFIGNVPWAHLGNIASVALGPRPRRARRTPRGPPALA